MTNDFLIPEEQNYPQDEEQRKQVTKRHRWGRVWRVLFFTATASAIVILLILLANILNQSFGLVAIQNENSPDSLLDSYLLNLDPAGQVPADLEELPKEALVAILADNS